jgi:NADH:ubiquinone oxidoreductase subunit 2 (subunit N)
MINLYTDTNALLFTYMFLYNLSLISMFWVLLSYLNSNSKTLYSLTRFSFSPALSFNLIIVLFSMAGVPPFAGFFTKLFLLVILTTNNFALLYPLLIVLLLVSLYFYVQNMRFLLTTNAVSLSSSNLVNERVCLSMTNYIVNISFLLIIGVFLLDELVALFKWILL